jgi:hypothetical protein
VHSDTVQNGLQKGTFSATLNVAKQAPVAPVIAKSFDRQTTPNVGGTLSSVKTFSTSSSVFDPRVDDVFGSEFAASLQASISEAREISAAPFRAAAAPASETQTKVVLAFVLRNMNDAGKWTVLELANLVSQQ